MDVSVVAAWDGARVEAVDETLELEVVGCIQVDGGRP